MPDYSKAKIYKLTSPNTDKVYYGSTVKTLKQRLSQHVSEAKKKLRHHCTSKAIVDAGECTIELVEECPCENIEELRARERWWIENIPCVNQQIPGRTRNEWRRVYPERVKAWKKAYRQSEHGKAVVKALRKAYKTSERGKAAQRAAQRNYYHRQKAKRNFAKCLSEIAAMSTPHACTTPQNVSNTTHHTP